MPAPYGVAMGGLVPGRRRRGGGAEPSQAFEVTLWRALAVFRLATLAYAAVLVIRNVHGYHRPHLAWAVVGVMTIWSLATISGYAGSARPGPAQSGSAGLRRGLIVGADLVVTAGCLLASRWVIGTHQLSIGLPTLTVTWMACPVIAVAIAYRRRWGVAAAVAVGACDLGVRGLYNQATFTGTVIMVLTALAVGQVARLAAGVEERLREAARREAANRERERLARGIHDSVLQVLALVQRRGAELGGEAAELGRLAGEQEAALRSLVNSDAPAPTGLTDLRAALAGVASPTVSLATPATAVLLPAPVAAEICAATTAALENVRVHAGPGARAWVLVEEEGEQVIVSIRDDGSGLPEGRLAQAEAEGRLGVAQSIRGRLRDLGGTASITSAPAEGTEVELRVARPRLVPPARLP
jgi:signal transduction histidine kinase